MTGRLPLFDALRGLAMFVVFAAHVTFTLGMWNDHALSEVWIQLSVGVALFFVISGFLMYRPFAAAHAQPGRPEPGLFPYGVRRVLRIVPAYWVALTIIAIWLNLAYVFTPEGVAIYYGFLQIYDESTTTRGIPIAWTLCIEVSFYVFVPLWALGMRLLARRWGASYLVREAAPLVTLILASVAWKVAVVELVPDESAAFWPLLISLPGFLDQLGMGMLLAVLLVGLAGRERRPAPIRLIEQHAWVVVLLVVAVFAGLVAWGGAFLPGSPNGLIYQHLLKGIIGALLVSLAVFGATHRDVVRRGLSFAPLAWFGVISYAFYLWHLPILGELERAGVAGAAGGIGFTLAALAATTAVAAASWYGMEQHAIGLGKRITDRWRLRHGRPVPAPAQRAGGVDVGPPTEQGAPAEPAPDSPDAPAGAPATVEPPVAPRRAS